MFFLLIKNYLSPTYDSKKKPHKLKHFFITDLLRLTYLTTGTKLLHGIRLIQPGKRS